MPAKRGRSSGDARTAAFHNWQANQMNADKRANRRASLPVNYLPPQAPPLTAGYSYGIIPIPVAPPLTPGMNYQVVPNAPMHGDTGVRIRPSASRYAVRDVSWPTDTVLNRQHRVIRVRGNLKSNYELGRLNRRTEWGHQSNATKMGNLSAVYKQYRQDTQRLRAKFANVIEQREKLLYHN